MKLTAAVQEGLVSLLCYDDQSAGVVSALVPPGQFDPFYADVAQAAVNYYEQHKKAPGAHTIDLINVLQARRPDAAELYDRIWKTIEGLRGEINREYILKRASSFSKRQRLKTGIEHAIRILESKEDEESLAKAETSLRRGLEQRNNLFESGVFLADHERSLGFLDQVFESFPTGIDRLDKLGLGPRRKCLHLFVGMSGAGKSWWLVNLVKQCVLARKRALYISLELSEEAICRRFMQAFFSIGKWDVPHTYQVFERNEDGQFLGLNEKTVQRPAFNNPKIRQHLIEKLEGLRMREPVVIRQFPTGSLTLAELEAYMDGLEASRGFIPDLVVVDYPDLMHLDATDLRISTGQLYKRLRGMAIERNFALAVVSQAHRSARDVTLITDRHVAEDFSKAQTSDAILTYNQTYEEHNLGLARLFQAKGREDADKFTVLISQAYSIGQFVLDSVGMVSSYWDSIRNEGDDANDE